MPTPSEILGLIDASVNLLLPVLEAGQTQYKLANGHFWQGLPTHSALPEDGAYAEPDQLSATATNLAEDWLQVGYNIGPSRVCLWIDTYDGPVGEGYVLNLALRIEGRQWNRRIAFGPDQSHSSDWMQAEEGGD
jgi:hypothetical protein